MVQARELSKTNLNMTSMKTVSLLTTQNRLTYQESPVFVPQRLELSQECLWAAWSKHQDHSTTQRNDQKSKMLQSILSDIAEKDKVDWRNKPQHQTLLDRVDMPQKWVRTHQISRICQDGLCPKLVAHQLMQDALTRTKLMIPDLDLESNLTQKINLPESAHSARQTEAWWRSRAHLKTTWPQQPRLNCTTQLTENVVVRTKYF